MLPISLGMTLGGTRGTFEHFETRTRRRLSAWPGVSYQICSCSSLLLDHLTFMNEFSGIEARLR